MKEVGARGASLTGDFGGVDGSGGTNRDGRAGVTGDGKVGVDEVAMLAVVSRNCISSLEISVEVFRSFSLRRCWNRWEAAALRLRFASATLDAACTSIGT